jgi:hypothetical protein
LIATKNTAVTLGLYLLVLPTQLWKYGAAVAVVLARVAANMAHRVAQALMLKRLWLLVLVTVMLYSWRSQQTVLIPPLDVEETALILQEQVLATSVQKADLAAVVAVSQVAVLPCVPVVLHWPTAVI